jgi:hypothetical protein
MTIDWVNKLQNLLQTMAFSLAIATLQYAFTPDRPYAPPIRSPSASPSGS